MSASTPADVIRGRGVLVTGGTGFLGRTLVRRLVSLQPSWVRILSLSETRRAELQRSLSGSALQIEFITGDLADPFVVRRAVDRVQVVFHLAAMKQVVYCEQQPYEAVKTNVIGSKMLIDAAVRESAVERFVAVSSDKSANPFGVYGMTKALMERMVCEAQAATGPAFGTVRCGNLWGGTDSVVPIWLRSVREGRELLVTDPAMTRFVILAQEAVDLLLEAAARGLQGEILARAMPAYLLGVLADVFRERYGAAIRMIGARPYEKLHEDLIAPVEAPFTKRMGDDFLITPAHLQEVPSAPFSSADAAPLSKERLVQLLAAEEMLLG